MMKNKGKSYNNIAVDFANMRDSFDTEQKHLDTLINYIPEKSPRAFLDKSVLMTGWPLFFQNSKTEEESSTIAQELSKLINVKESLASAVENISDEPEGPAI